MWITDKQPPLLCSEQKGMVLALAQQVKSS